MTPINTEQQEPLKAPQSGTPGSLLRQAREASGQTQPAVAEALHLTVHYIKSLENDDYSKLPGLIFVKGYMRTYARYLKIDVDNVMACYDAHVGALPQMKNHTLGGNYTRKRNDQAIGWALAAAMVVLMGLGAGWWFFGRQEPAASEALATMPSAAEQANRSATATSRSTTAVVAAPAQAATMPTAPVTGPNAYTAPAYAAGTAPQPALADGIAVGTVEAAVTTALPTADVVSGAATILPATAGHDSVIVAVATVQGAASAVTGTTATTTTDTTTGTTLTPDAVATASAAVTTATDSTATITPSPAGGRQINLLGTGTDQLQLTFSGNSWVEIDDGRNVRLYNEMLRGGDTLLVQGQAPFQLLFGDGRNVAVTFNSSPVDISSSIRSDSTSRITLSNPATMTVPLEEPAASPLRGAAEPAPTAPAVPTTPTGNNGVVQ